MARPEWGTAPIRCGKRKCKWKGLETELNTVPCQFGSGVVGSQSVCPTCGNDSYMFMTEKEIASWMLKRIS